MDALQASNFLGHYHGDGLSCRVEATPIATFIGHYGEGRECCTVKSVNYLRKIPQAPKSLLDAIILDFKLHPEMERIVQLYWDEKEQKHFLAYPDAEKASRVSIFYHFAPRPMHQKLVATIHSHNTMAAYFSATDDADEIYTGVFGVVGRIDQPLPELKLRVGMEGAFSDLLPTQLFAL